MNVVGAHKSKRRKIAIKIDLIAYGFFLMMIMVNQIPPTNQLFSNFYAVFNT